MEKVIRKRFSKILRTLGICIVILIFLLTLLITLGRIFKNEKQLSPWGTGFFVVLTNSMEPAFSAGSLIFVREIPADEIAPDDILTFYSSNGQDIVTHRVKEVNSGNNNYIFTTRGDANDINDPPVTYEKVIGKMLFSIPGIGSAAGVFQNATFLGAVVIGVSLILCVFGIFSGIRKKSEAPDTVQEKE